MDIDAINAIDPHRPPIHNARRIWGRAGAGHHLTDPSPIVNTSESKQSFINDKYGSNLSNLIIF